MPDASDILKDPTKVLDMALHTSDARLGLVEFGRIHRHMLAGGPPPAQWRGEGTAVGRMVDDERANLDHFSSKMTMTHGRGEELAYRNNARATADAIRAVTGEG